MASAFLSVRLIVSAAKNAVLANTDQMQDTTTRRKRIKKENIDPVPLMNRIKSFTIETATNGNRQ